MHCNFGWFQTYFHHFLIFFLKICHSILSLGMSDFETLKILIISEPLLEGGVIEQDTNLLYKLADQLAHSLKSITYLTKYQCLIPKYLWKYRNPMCFTLITRIWYLSFEKVGDNHWIICRTPFWSENSIWKFLLFFEFQSLLL